MYYNIYHYIFSIKSSKKNKKKNIIKKNNFKNLKILVILSLKSSQVTRRSLKFLRE